MNPRRALAFIFCKMALEVLAHGVMIPVLPRIVLGFMDADTAGATEMFGVFATVWALVQFLCSPLLGALSDRYGRRPVILISCMGLGLDYIFMALAPTLLLLFLGRVVSGITSATIGTSFAYIADVTKPQEPGQGLWSGRHGVRARLPGRSRDRRPAGWSGSAPALLGLSRGLSRQCGVRVVRATRIAAAGKRMAFSWKRANPVGSLKLLASQRQLLGLASVDFLGNFAHQFLPAVFVLYAGHRYG
jgi:DHA1 family tetracycline resistance protein-like MFS transporter